MENKRALAPGYLTVGEAAKKMGVTVRTLQYYDKEGLLHPSAESEGGRRLYSGKDIVQLHQILSLKHLGFSLSDIKNRLIPLDAPADVANALSEQAAVIREKIEALTEALKETEALKREVLQMQSVDFKKYADIIINLQMKNEFYWLIKHFDDATLDYLRNRFDKDSGLAMMEKFNALIEEATQLQKDKTPPESEKGLRFAEAFWNMVVEFTEGDMSLLPKLMEMGRLDSLDANSGWKQKQDLAFAFIEPALDAYFKKLGADPFKKETT